MRGIKLKIWDKVHQKWTNGSPRISFLWDARGKFHQISDFEFFEIVMFTGLVDNYGNEIWEGDILKYIEDIAQDGTKILFVKNKTVRYIDGCFMLVNLHKGKEYPSDHLSDGSSFGITHKWRKIGNIFENPELWGGL